MPVDYNGVEIKEGDIVVFTQPKYTGFIEGVVLEVKPATCKVEHVDKTHWRKGDMRVSQVKAVNLMVKIVIEPDAIAMLEEPKKG